EMYHSEIDRITDRDHHGNFGRKEAEAATSQYLAEGRTGDFLELGEVGRRRIFNLGYYTWVEQQGVALEDFEVRRHQGFWTGLRSHLDTWDAMIGEFNERTRVRA
ncbi:MAG: pyridoxal-5'-phosphate-dependent protein subunit beta, partial [Acidimicrobiia bacterium]